MYSDTPDVCSWCHKDLRNVPAQGHTVVTSRHTAPPRRGPVRQPVQPRPAAAPPPAMPPEPTRQIQANGAAAAAQPPPSVPQMGTFTAVKSKYYGDKVMDPVSGAHYDADTGQTVEGEVEKIEVEQVNPYTALALNAVVLVALAVTCSLVADAYHSLAFWALGISNFVAGLVMPLLRTVGFEHDDPEDVPIFLALVILFGPLVGMIAYGFKWVVTQDWNPAIIGIFISSFILRLATEAGLGTFMTSFVRMMPFHDFSLPSIIGQAMPIVALAGWYCASVFHKPDE